MASMATTSLAQQLGALFEGGSTAGLSDRQLIERFAASRDEAAFAALVDRHGPMVLGVCRQLLGNGHDAEDAFQAVFLVLARKAPSLREPELLGNWLYGVALRTARKARLRLARRRQTEEEGAVRRPEAAPAAPAEGALLDREQSEALHGEIDRLPGAFRAPVVLCYFEGLTLDEAAHRLRWPVGTLRSRLARARDKLRRGLTRRGVAISTTALGAALAPRSASASVSPLLCDSTTKAAIHFAAGHAAGGALSAHAAATAREVARTMLLHKLRLIVLTVMALAAVATGAGWLTRSLAMKEDPAKGPAPAHVGRVSPDPARTPDRRSPEPDPARMTIAGRVLDPSGNPLSGARVAVLADRKRQVGDIDGRHRNILMGTATADAQGRFTLEFPAIAANRLEHLGLIAAAPGRALSAVDLKTDAARQETSITLAPEKPVEGRLVDVQGQPAAGVVIRVRDINFTHNLQPYEAKGGLSLWPSPVTTGPDGRFRMLGLGENTPATYEVEDPRFAHQEFSFHAVNSGEEKLRPGGTITLRPAQSLEVRVLHNDDGKPVAGARVDVQSEEGMNHRPTDHVAHARTDGQGRAQVVPWPAESFRVHVYPPEGEPYIPVLTGLDWPKAAVRHSLEVKVRPGVVVQGRVIEDPAGTPVAGAWVVYHQTHRDNPRYRNLPHIEAATDADGRFTLVVPRGPGHLLAQGPTADYLHVETSFGKMGAGIRPSFHMYPDALAALDIKDGEATLPVEFRLRRGVTVSGRVVTPDGKPVAKAFAVGRSYAPYQENAFPLVPFNGIAPRIEVNDGRFEIPGCDPEKPSTFYFLDLDDRLGATVELSGRSMADGPVTVRLQPAASARVLEKDADGRPIANCEASEELLDLKLVITPGPDFHELNNNEDLTPSDVVYYSNLIWRPEGRRVPRSGPDGRVTIDNLIPGAPYRFRNRDFRPGPGQTVDLGEVVIKNPPG
jgi:RNA polymerase sigma factor (sigma-70 family)